MQITEHNKMVKVRQFSYALPSDRTVEDIITELQNLYTVVEGSTQQSCEQFMDTFDWRLFRQGLILQRNGGHYSITTLQGTIVSEVQGTRKKNPFWWDFSDGPFCETLQKVLDMRTLLPILEVQKKSRFFKLLNKDRKTVAKLRVEVGDAMADSKNRGELFPVLFGNEIRGYQSAFEKVAHCLSMLKCRELTPEESLLPRALDVVNRKAPDYTSKFSITLEPDSRIHEAVSAICFKLLYAMERNLQGVIDDLDSEFLHDFRIAVRRTRSLLSQLKKVLPHDETQDFINEFRWLGNITGAVRDLDVYLLEKDEYKAMLPEQLWPGLTIFFENLEQIRKKEIRTLRKELTAERVRQLFIDWEQFHLSVPGPSWRKAEKSCKKVAVKVLRKRFARILNEGEKIHRDTPDAALHRLRIQGKKLRYLVEFFRSFFPQENVDIFLKQMKKLQNNLGDFNDLAVQQGMLSEYQESLAGRNKRTLKVASALGGLIAHLNDEQQRVRKKYEKTFHTFSNTATVTLFEETFTY